MGILNYVKPGVQHSVQHSVQHGVKRYFLYMIFIIYVM